MITRLSLFVLALALAGMTPAYAQPVTPLAQLKVIDAKGKLVGPVVTTNNNLTARVALNVGGLTLVMTVAKDRFTASEGEDFVFFDSPDCTGNAFINTDFYSPTNLPRFLFPLAQVGLPNMTVYIGEGEEQSFQTQSVSVTDVDFQSGFDCFEFGLTETRPRGVPAQPLVDLSTHFTQPFSIR